MNFMQPKSIFAVSTSGNETPTQPERNTSEKIKEIIPLMELVVRPNQPRATRLSYCNKAKPMSELMKIEQLYFLNEEKCF